ncbi:MAG: galactokinase [Bacteroidetes bacterium]|nr:galactokinase [Bacteroidota bacterium]
MKNINELKEYLKKDDFRKTVEPLYGSECNSMDHIIERFEMLLSRFKEKFNGTEVELFSTPGRTEICGNHTDHNHGKVLAASVNLDSVACAEKNENGFITIYSSGFKDAFIVNISELQPKQEEAGKTEALIRGVTARIKELGFKVGGFNAYIDSNVLIGSGLSSSASIEVLIGTILNHLYNDEKIGKVYLAQIAQFAENKYFGKPCGLMDQIACSVGGIVAIDFEDPNSPKVEQIEFDFKSTGYSLIVVNTGESHADLTDEYAAIPAEMKKIAQFFSKEVCREIEVIQIIENISILRETIGDRAVMRALHFIWENDRVDFQLEALKQNQFDQFLKHVRASGNSSFKYLQNCFDCKNIKEQGISLALALTEDYLFRIGEGSCRVHGGGFAGTIQVFLPDERVDDYLKMVNKIFGVNSGLRLSIRNVGTTKISI